jgi:hypothetical protein
MSESIYTFAVEVIIRRGMTKPASWRKIKEVALFAARTAPARKCKSKDARERRAAVRRIL